MAGMSYIEGCLRKDDGSAPWVQAMAPKVVLPGFCFVPVIPFSLQAEQSQASHTRKDGSTMVTCCMFPCGPSGGAPTSGWYLRGLFGAPFCHNVCTARFPSPCRSRRRLARSRRLQALKDMLEGGRTDSMLHSLRHPLRIHPAPIETPSCTH